MSQKVLRKERLKLDLLLKFPDINRNKSYKAIERKYIVTVDEEPAGLVDMTTVPSLMLAGIRLRSLIKIEKVFGSKLPDAIFTYRVGENFATITNQRGEVKRIALSFEDTNTVFVKDDIDWRDLKDISK